MRRNTRRYKRIALLCAVALVMSTVDTPVHFVNAGTLEDMGQGDSQGETENGGEGSVSGGDTVTNGITIQPELELVLDEQNANQRTATLTAAFDPENATDRTLLWSSDKPEIVSVSAEESDTGAVDITANTVGSAVITAALKTDESKTAQCRVTVKSVPVSVGAITLNSSSDGQGNSLGADNILATQKVFYLFAALNPEAQYCTDSSIDWSVEKGKSFVTLNGNCVTILDLPENENPVTFTAKTVNGCTGTVTVTIKKVQPEIRFEQQASIEYGNDIVSISAGVYDGNVPVAANLTYELVTGDGLLGGDEISIDPATGRVSPHKMGNFKVKVSYGGDGTYQAAVAEKEFQVSRKMLNVVLTDPSAIIQKVSDGTMDLTEDNKEKIKSLIAIQEGQVLTGDTVELEVTVPDTTQYDNLEVYTEDWDSRNSVALKDVRITIKTDDGKYCLDTTAVEQASLAARITPIPVSDKEVNLKDNGGDVAIHNRTIIFKGGTRGRNGEYWYGKDGVPVSVTESGVDLRERKKWFLSSSVLVDKNGNKFMEVDGEINACVRQNNTYYGSYHIIWQMDKTEPSITLTSVKTEDGADAGEMVFDKKVIYTIKVTDVGSGIREKGKEGIVYGIASTNNVSGVATWTEPASLEETQDAQGRWVYTFRVETESSGYLFVRATDCVGNTAISGAIRPIILESDAPSLQVECDNTEYRQNHTVSVTAKDAEEAGSSPYTYSGIAKVEYVLVQDGNVVFQTTAENAAPKDMNQIPQRREFTHQLTNLQKGNVGIYDGQDLDGSYQLTVTVYDNCGNSASDSCELYFDNTAPGASVFMENGTTDTNGNYYYRADNCDIRVGIKDARIAEGVTYQITVGGKPVAEGIVTENTEIPLAKEEIAKCEDGKVTVGVTFTDKAGNVNTRFNEVTNLNCNQDKTEAYFILDTKAPITKVEMEGGNALDNTYYYRADNCGVLISFEDSDGENAPVRGGQAQYKVSVGRQDGTESEIVLADGTNTIRLEADEVKAYGDGSRTITVTAIDVAGNVMTGLLTAEEGSKGVVIDKNEASFVLDTAAPKLTAVSLKETDSGKGGVKYYSNEPQNVYLNSSYTVTYTVEEDNYISDAGYVDMDWGETIVDGEAADCYFDTRDKAAITLKVDTRGKQIENAHYCPTLTVKDKAGNVLVKDASFDNQGYDYNNITVDNDGKATMDVCQVLDNVAPVLDSVKVVKHTGTVIPDYNDAAYINGVFSVTYHVTEQNYSNENDLVIFGADGFHSIHPSFVSQDKNEITMRVEPGDNQNIEGDTYIPHLKVTDKAGNHMVLSENFDDDGKEYNRGTVADGTAQLDKKLILDTKAPVVTIDYTEPGISHYYAEPDGTYAYYNKKYGSLTASYRIEEKNFDSSKIWIGYSEDGGEIFYREVKASANQTNSPDTLDIPITDDMDEVHYQFAAYGEDCAGNPVTVVDKQAVKEASVINSITAKDCSKENKYVSSSHKVIDTVAPTYTLQIESPGSANRGLDTVHGNRYYFNSGFQVKIAVNVDEYVGDRIFIRRAYVAGRETVDSSAVAIDRQEQFTTRLNSDTNVYTDVVNAGDGVYRYQIYGTDRAGNSLTCTGNSGNVEAGALPVSGQEDESVSDLSVPVVLDTVKPQVRVMVNEILEDRTLGDCFYQGTLTREEKYEQGVNQPYRSKTKAQAVVTGSDFSPIKLNYTFESSNSAAGNRNMVYNSGKFIKNDSQTIDWNGQQTVRMMQLTATDLAGNTATAANSYNGAVSTKMYLDVDAPNQDELAPGVQIQLNGANSGTTRGGVYGTDGLPLYVGDVTAQVKISDLNKEQQSSGLYKVYYKVEVAGQDWTQRNVVGITSRTDSGISPEIGNGVIYYGTSGVGAELSADEVLTYTDNLTFTFRASDFNYNDVRLTVWAEDNSGNKMQSANYITRAFGIDVTAPKVKVVYDNNDVKNEKYFLADRIATIVVTERNFNEAETKITTEQEAVISGWEHAAGGAANGDEDTWTCSVAYRTDGDYTFDIATVDLAGNKMAGSVDYGNSMAPKEFVIDKTVPIIRISFDNDDVRNGKYYNAGRIATVEIEEHNFAEGDAKVSVTASIAEGSVETPGITGWVKNADNNSTHVNFTQDGDYTMAVEYTDLAGNAADVVVVDEFTVDTTPPVLEIGGVEDHSANQGEAAPTITYHDINYAADKTEVAISGYKNRNGKNLTGIANESQFGGKFICDNIAEIPENDDVYLCVGHVEDLAGNSSEAEVTFSVNRFGSNYILDDSARNLVEQYYTNKAPTIQVTEINVNSLEFQEITATMNGDILDLVKGQDYQVTEAGGEGSWKEYHYTIPAEFFDKDSVYNITIHSRDEAQNENSNRTAKTDEYTQPIDFVLDTTAPVVVISGVEDDEQYAEDSRTITLIAEDNIRLENLQLYLDEQLVADYGEEELAQTGGTVTYLASSSNNWQNLRVVAKDKAGNTTQDVGVRFLLTSNVFIQYIHNTPAVVTTVTAVTVAGAGIGVARFRIVRRKPRKAGKKTA